MQDEPVLRPNESQEGDGRKKNLNGSKSLVLGPSAERCNWSPSIGDLLNQCRLNTQTPQDVIPEVQLNTGLSWTVLAIDPAICL